MKTKTKIIIFTVTFFACIIATFFIISKNNKVEALSKYGSRGSEVTQIQTKLKRWGYYKGNIDGIYGKKLEVKLPRTGC